MAEKETDKRARRRELRKEKLQKRTEEQKLPWEERKKRLQGRKKKENIRKNMKLAAILFAIIVVSIMAVAVSQNLPESQDIFERKGPGGRGGGNFNLAEWDTSVNVSIPEGNPNLVGRIIEETGEYSFTLQTMGRETPSTEEKIVMDDLTNIFKLDRESQTLFEASIDEIHVDSTLMVWGEEQSNGTWLVSDVGLMQKR